MFVEKKEVGKIWTLCQWFVNDNALSCSWHGLGEEFLIVLLGTNVATDLKLESRALKEILGCIPIPSFLFYGGDGMVCQFSPFRMHPRYWRSIGELAWLREESSDDRRISFSAPGRYYIFPEPSSYVWGLDFTSSPRFFIHILDRLFCFWKFETPFSLS